MHAGSLFCTVIIALLTAYGTDSAAQPGSRPVRDTGAIDSSFLFTMFAIGDAGKPGDILLENAKALEIEAERLRKTGNPVSTMVFAGDNFYPVGLNHDEEVRLDLVNDVLGPMAGFLRTLGRKNVHAIPGNHDYYCDMFGPAPYGKCESGKMVPAFTLN